MRPGVRTKLKGGAWFYLQPVYGAHMGGHAIVDLSVILVCDGALHEDLRHWTCCELGTEKSKPSNL
jgi:hypothetical protein